MIFLKLDNYKYSFALKLLGQILDQLIKDNKYFSKPHVLEHTADKRN